MRRFGSVVHLARRPRPRGWGSKELDRYAALQRETNAALAWREVAAAVALEALYQKATAGRGFVGERGEWLAAVKPAFQSHDI